MSRLLIKFVATLRRISCNDAAASMISTVPVFSHHPSGYSRPSAAAESFIRAARRAQSGALQLQKRINRSRGNASGSGRRKGKGWRGGDTDEMVIGGRNKRHAARSTCALTDSDMMVDQRRRQADGLGGHGRGEGAKCVQF